MIQGVETQTGSHRAQPRDRETRDRSSRMSETGSGRCHPARLRVTAPAVARIRGLPRICLSQRPSRGVPASRSR